jgi:ABC-type transport system involved in multi-copper enzyme maturation permease subunit
VTRIERTGFLRLLHAEWTKLRTVPAWVAGLAVTAAALVLVAVLAGISSDQGDQPRAPVGPDGSPVTDSFYVVHRPLVGDGTITVAVHALESSIPTSPAELEPGTVPWAKAGLIIKEGTRQGSPYAALMVTGSHGVRMQHGFVHDTAGPPGSASAATPRWLRLDRSGDEITGAASVDGTSWTDVGVVQLPGLGPTAQVGLFVASPPSVDGIGTRGTVSTAVFRDLRVDRGRIGGDWTGEQVGGDSPTFAGYPRGMTGSHQDVGGTLTVTGAGDIAPAVRETLPTGGTLAEVLTGVFPALVAAIVVGTLFSTTEHGSKLLLVTLSAGPGRARVLLAKAIVLGGATFVLGLAGTTVAIPLGQRLAADHGVDVFPVGAITEVRVAFGTAALLALSAVLAMAMGVILRDSAAAVTAVIVAIVVPYVVVSVPFVPAAVSDWLTRVTPAAAFAVQQTLVPRHQVESIYTAYDGYYPLAPWAGLAVLAGYTAACLAVAALLLRRRDP